MVRRRFRHTFLHAMRRILSRFSLLIPTGYSSGVAQGREALEQGIERKRNQGHERELQYRLPQQGAARKIKEKTGQRHGNPVVRARRSLSAQDEIDQPNAGGEVEYGLHMCEHGQHQKQQQ